MQRVTRDDLVVGLICADRDGNRIRIDQVKAEKVSFHFLNDELRVQEGVQEVLIDGFINEGWYLA